MRKTALLSIAAVVLASTAAHAISAHSIPVCTVADPTGTPLNIRSMPNGTIIGAFKNGAPVIVLDIKNQWAFLYEANQPAPVSGWVFGPYLANCHWTD
jgi:hypothetical protein